MSTPTNGKALLADATAETLERDAALLTLLATDEYGTSSADRDALLCAAALVRAVAKMQAMTDAEVTKAGGNVFLTFPETAVWNACYDSIPHAIASLLDGGEG